MIRIGQAGIPLSCKGRTNKDGIQYTKEILDLNAMEVQFVRGLYEMEDNEANFMKKYAEDYDIELHVHAPYYINLAGTEEAEISFEKIMYSAELADKMGAETVIVHPGYYGERDEDKTMEKITNRIKELKEKFDEKNIQAKIGLETMGKRKVFGSLDEIIELCKNIDDVIPVLEIGHIHARGDGCLQEREDFEEIFEKLEPMNLDHYLIHLTGVMYENGSELHHMPIKKSDLSLDPLIDVILDNNYNVTLISESPLMEHDAIYIRLQVEKEIAKRSDREEADFRDLSEII